MWVPQPLTTLRASKACRGENLTFTFIYYNNSSSALSRNKNILILEFKLLSKNKAPKLMTTETRNVRKTNCRSPLNIRTISYIQAAFWDRIPGALIRVDKNNLHACISLRSLEGNFWILIRYNDWYCVHYPLFELLLNDVSRTGLCLRPQFKKPTQSGPNERPSSYLCTLDSKQDTIYKWSVTEMICGS
jgi:hypothetical protein